MPENEEFLKENLLYLVLVRENTICLGCITQNPPSGLEVNLVEGTWSYGGETFAIGQRRQPANLPQPGQEVMYGVYDFLNWEHMEQMKEDANAYLKQPPALNIPKPP